ncbi:hypothetical protein Taro_024754 [Colocasia esculenta]|uniref:Uncharacterized protein n=1 Tax=Colocasia esculenta TaxID=4460 RepID=A0A843V743_COLES|nr:hypothetical protein [Colocasia esculenta]
MPTDVPIPHFALPCANNLALALAYSPASVFTTCFDLSSRKSPLRILPGVAAPASHPRRPSAVGTYRAALDTAKEAATSSTRSIIVALKIDFIDEINPFKETWKIKESNENLELDESIKHGEQITDVDTCSTKIASAFNAAPVPGQHRTDLNAIICAQLAVVVVALSSRTVLRQHAAPPCCRPRCHPSRPVALGITLPCPVGLRLCCVALLLATLADARLLSPRSMRTANHLRASRQYADLATSAPGQSSFAQPRPPPLSIAVLPAVHTTPAPFARGRIRLHPCDVAVIAHTSASVLAAPAAFVPVLQSEKVS